MTGHRSISDVAWQLWIARRMHAGANLYRDIIETNPPLWFWMALPVDRLRDDPPCQVELGARCRNRDPRSLCRLSATEHVSSTSSHREADRFS